MTLYLRTSVSNYHSNLEQAVRTLREEVHQLFDVRDAQTLAPKTSDEAVRFEFTVEVESEEAARETVHESSFDFTLHDQPIRGRPSFQVDALSATILD